MKDETELENLIAMRQKAEKAVDGMPEGAIKEKAFEVAFRYLLDGYSPSAKGDKGIRRKKGSASRRASTAAQAEARRRPSKKGGPMAIVTELIEDGFFDEQRCLSDIQSELEKRSHHFKLTDLSPAMGRLTRGKKLRREREKQDTGRSIWFYKRFDQR